MSGEKAQKTPLLKKGYVIYVSMHENIQRKSSKLPTAFSKIGFIAQKRWLCFVD